MEENKVINIELVKGSLSDYIIKDKNFIIIGRFTITDFDKDNKKYNVKFKFYRDSDYNLLVEAIRTILKAIFKDSYIHKANFIVSESSNLRAFLDEGFELQGILTDNIFSNGRFQDEIILGITRNNINSGFRIMDIKLEGQNIVVKTLTPDCAKELAEYYLRNKKHLQSFEPNRDNSFYTEEVQGDILRESYRQYLNGTTVELGIYKNNMLIGKAKLSNIVYGIFKNGILGYSIDKEEQGKGFMKEAVNLILEYAKEELELHRIEASVLVDNKRSKGVLLGCGFNECGLNKNYLFINGKWRDHLTYYKIL